MFPTDLLSNENAGLAISIVLGNKIFSEKMVPQSKHLHYRLRYCHTLFIQTKQNINGLSIPEVQPRGMLYDWN